MHYQCIDCDFLLRTITKKDDLFHANYCIDPYHHCEFGCRYCDSSFEEKIYIKKNSTEILEKELESISNGTIIIGSVHDPYQPVEKKYMITKNILLLLKKKELACHILTKSPLILRDIDILSSMNCRVTISIISLDKQITDIFEHQHIASAHQRLQTVKTLTDHNIKTGVALIPILPYITDNEIEYIIKETQKNNALYLLHKYLELKGEQKTKFFSLLQNNYPTLTDKYTTLYEDSIKPKKKYMTTVDKTIAQLCKHYNVSQKIQ